MGFIKKKELLETLKQRYYYLKDHPEKSHHPAVKSEIRALHWVIDEMADKYGYVGIDVLVPTIKPFMAKSLYGIIPQTNYAGLKKDVLKDKKINNLIHEPGANLLELCKSMLLHIPLIRYSTAIAILKLPTTIEMNYDSVCLALDDRYCL